MTAFTPDGASRKLHRVNFARIMPSAGGVRV